MHCIPARQVKAKRRWLAIWAVRFFASRLLFQRLGLPLDVPCRSPAAGARAAWLMNLKVGVVRDFALAGLGILCSKAKPRQALESLDSGAEGGREGRPCSKIHPFKSLGHRDTLQVLFTQQRGVVFRILFGGNWGSSLSSGASFFAGKPVPAWLTSRRRLAACANVLGLYGLFRPPSASA